MDEDDTSKNISRIRTFQSDMVRSREKHGDNFIPDMEAHEIPDEQNDGKLEKVNLKEDTAHVNLSSEEPKLYTPEKSLPAATAKTRNAAGDMSLAEQIKNINIPEEQTAKIQARSTNETLKKTGYVTLNDEIEKVAKPQKESILSDNTIAYKSGTQNEGSIIRDTKRKRFQLLPAMVSATVGWLEGIKSEYELATKPKHTIAKAESRTSVIQKAVSQGEHAPQEDFKQVSEHLKSIERVPVSAALTFKDKSKIPEPTWLSLAEDKTEETPEFQNKAKEPFSEEKLTDKKNNEAIVQESVPILDKIPLTRKTQVPSAPEKPLKIFGIVDTSGIEETKINEPEISERKSKPQKTKRSRRAEQKKIQPKKYERAIKYDQAPFPIFAFIGVVIVASLLGVGASYYWLVLKDAPETKAIVYKIPALIAAEAQAPLALPEGRIDMLSGILSLVHKTTAVTEIYLTESDDHGTQMPSTAENILQKLELRTPGSFTRSVKEIVFGGTSNAEPFIIIKATSFDVAFAGMLEWEKTMSSDLFPLFGQPVTESFDASARTDTQVRDAFFKDIITSNKNARVLLNEKGEERIIYTFVDQNTILITTTQKALDELIPLVR